MRKQLVHVLKGTALVVLFVLCLPYFAQAALVSPEKVIIVNNAALSTGQSLSIKSYKITAGKESLIKNISVGPVEADCTNGCGTETTDMSAGTGEYRIEVRTDADDSGLTAVTFNMKEGEEYMWMVTNRANPKASKATAPGIKLIGNEAGVFRIDLVTYTAGVKLDAPATPVTVKKTDRGFWPFKPTTTTKWSHND